MALPRIKEDRDKLIQNFIKEYRIHEDNETVCELLNIPESDGIRLLSDRNVFAVLAGDGCYFNSDALFSSLSDQEQSFINEFLLDFDATKAAGRAGYQSDYAAGRKHLMNPVIRFVILCRQNELRDLSQVTAQAVLNEYAKIAFADIGNFVEFDNNTVTLKDSSGVDTSMISEVQSTQHGVKIKLHNKQTALEALGKSLGMFREKVEVTGKDGGPLEVKTNLDALRSKLDQIVNRAKSQAVSEMIEEGTAEVVKDSDNEDNSIN